MRSIGRETGWQAQQFPGPSSLTGMRRSVRLGAGGSGAGPARIGEIHPGRPWISMGDQLARTIKPVQRRRYVSEPSTSLNSGRRRAGAGVLPLPLSVWPRICVVQHGARRVARTVGSAKPTSDGGLAHSGTSSGSDLVFSSTTASTALVGPTLPARNIHLRLGLPQVRVLSSSPPTPTFSCGRLASSFFLPLERL